MINLIEVLNRAAGGSLDEIFGLQGMAVFEITLRPASPRPGDLPPFPTSLPDVRPTSRCGPRPSPATQGYKEVHHSEFTMKKSSFRPTSRYVAAVTRRHPCLSTARAMLSTPGLLFASPLSSLIHASPSLGHVVRPSSLWEHKDSST